MAATGTLKSVVGTNDFGKALSVVLKRHMQEKFGSQNAFFRAFDLDKRNFWTIAENNPQVQWIVENAQRLSQEPNARVSPGDLIDEAMQLQEAWRREEPTL